MARISKVELIRLQKKLKTDEAIGIKLGVTRQAVQQRRKKFGIGSSWGLNPERNKKILAMYKTGKTGTEISRKLGLSPSQVYRLIGVGKRKK